MPSPPKRNQVVIVRRRGDAHLEWSMATRAWEVFEMSRNIPTIICVCVLPVDLCCMNFHCLLVWEVDSIIYIYINTKNTINNNQRHHNNNNELAQVCFEAALRVSGQITSSVRG